MFGVLALLLAGASAASPGVLRSSVVLIVADDLGPGDLSCAGHPEHRTPNLDRLAAEGPTVRRFYVNPVGSTTRASLLTGRYAWRTRVVDTSEGRSMMEPEEATLAEVLRDAGYATGIFGKWHLGDCHPMRPVDQGFDVSLVHRGAGLTGPSAPPGSGGGVDPVLLGNGEEVRTEGYAADVVFDAALAFVDASLEDGKPFFALVAPNVPRGPFDDLPSGLLESERSAPEEGEPTSVLDEALEDRRRRVRAMVENLDRNVGRLLARLEERRLDEQTIVVFLSDNGPPALRGRGALRGGKGELHEGGIRSPLLVRWPGRFEPEAEVVVPTAHIDLFPTLLEMTHVGVPEDLAIDGASLVSLLEGDDEDWQDRRLFFQGHRGDAPVPEHNVAVVGDRWKLVRASGYANAAPDAEHPFELYDLANDPGETNDLAAAHPDRVLALRAEYREWFQDVKSTRPDNFAPPRIVVGSDAEPVTVLTLEERRASGRWLLAADRQTTVELELLFEEPVAVDEARIRIGDDLRILEVEALDGAGGETESAAVRLSAGSLALPAGRFDFRVELRAAGAPVDAHQVVIRSS